MVNSRKPHFTINEAMRKAAAGVIAVLTGGRINAGKIPQTFSAESANPQVDDYIGVSAVLEVPSPGVTPANIDRTVLQTRVRNGKLYADLAGQLAILVSEEKKKEAIMRLMIPDFMREPLERGDLEVLKGGFKNVSVGFIDLKNSTALSRAFAERGAADDYNRLLSLLFEAMGEETKRLGLGCCFLKYIGDCIMFVVGVPYAAKSDHGNSLRMATAMKRAALKLNSDPRAQSIYAKHRDLFVDETGKASSARFCTGIASGEVFAGDILRREIDYRAILTGQFFVDKPIVIDVMGNAANLAARLEGVAGAWEMVVDMRTIEGAREEGSLQEILDKDNKYCSDTAAIRDKLLIPYYKANGIDYNLKELNHKLEEYRMRFAKDPFTELNRTTPFVAQGKGTGIERVVYYHWDTRPHVLRLLREVGIITPEDNGETTPPSIKDILAKEYSTELIDKGIRTAIIDLVKRTFGVEIALPNGNMLAKLKAYINFVGIERLRAEAQLIEDPATRERVLKNLETVTRT